MAKDVNGNEIKAGMKVKRVSGHSYGGCEGGKEYEVTDCNSDRLRLETCTGVYTGNHFEIVPTPETQKAENDFSWFENIKVGQKLVILGHNFSYTETGDILVITKIASDRMDFDVYRNGNFIVKEWFNISAIWDALKHGTRDLKPYEEKQLHAFKVGDRVRLIAKPFSYCGMSERDFPIGGVYTIAHCPEYTYDWDYTLRNSEDYVCEVKSNQIEKLPDDKPSEPEYKPVNIPGMKEWGKASDILNKEPLPKSLTKPEPQSLAVKYLY